MLTLFTTAKPFEGHSGIIQRNALKSWRLLHPDVEVILFGDDAGSAEIAKELGLRHEPFVERNSFGTKRLDYIFGRAQELARHDFLCYCNCDIILLPEFCQTLKRVADTHPRFLMVGRRWDMDITKRLILVCRTGRTVLSLSHMITAFSNLVILWIFRFSPRALCVHATTGDRPRLVGSLAGLEGSSTGSGSSRCLRPSDRHSSKS
jgi:hypothetical protein